MSADEKAIVRYVADASQSKFTVQAFSSGVLAAGFGHDPTIAIRDFTGEVQFTPGSFANASVRFTIKAYSLTPIDDLKEKERQDMENLIHNSVMETAQYPEIVFQSTDIMVTRGVKDRYKARIIGSLTMHGVTRTSVWVQAQVKVEGDSIRATGDFMLKQTDYNIKRVSIMGGALKLKDELKFTFDIVANQEHG